MGLVVRKSSSEFVKPPEVATRSGHIGLSPVDKNVMSRSVTMLLVFDGPIQEPAETIKRALSKALVHYLPISGRLLDGELRITLTGEGVPFVAAAASCALKDVEHSWQQDVEQQLAVYYPAADDPLLMMQVTEFSCGGFVVGVTWNHAMADGAGMGQFLRAVGELARGLPSPSVVPVRSWHDDLFRGWVTNGFVKLARSFQPMDMAILDTTVPPGVIYKIKEEYRRVRGSSCTTFEAVTALLWQCRTRAIGLSDPEDPVAMHFVVDARRYARATDGYYGNCITAQHVVATRDAVAEGHLADVVEMIRRAKSRIADKFDEGKRGSAHASLAEHARGLMGMGYNLFLVTSWRNLGLEEVDFGGGRPVRVTKCGDKRVNLPACVVCQGIDGSNFVRSVFVTENHAGAFLRQVSSSFD